MRQDKNVDNNFRDSQEPTTLCKDDKNREWIKQRKSKRDKRRKTLNKDSNENFIERQVENELEDILVKAAFSTLL